MAELGDQHQRQHDAQCGERIAEAQQAHQEHRGVQQIQHGVIDRAHFVVDRRHDADVAGRQAQVDLVADEGLALALGVVGLLGQRVAQIDAGCEGMVFLAELLHCS